MTDEEGDLATQRARLEALRSGLGAQLASLRTAAGISQPQLGQALDRTRSFISKVEHGLRRMPEALWTIADELCDANGELVTAHRGLIQAEQDYRSRCRSSRSPVSRQVQPCMSPQLDVRHTIWPVSAGVGSAGYRNVVWAPETHIDAELAEELREVVTRLVKMMGRRKAMRLAGSVFAAVGLSGLLDADECMRIAQAVASPGRADAQVINNLAVTLTVCKRQEHKLGPCQVWDTVLAQHQLVRRLLAGDCPEQFRKPLHLIDSNMAATLGGYLIDMGQHEAARGYFEHARRAAHKASHPALAAYAAAKMSMAAFLCGDTPTALDTAAAARSLAARTADPKLKALAEQMAAAAYALDGQYNLCMGASARAHDFLTHANGSAVESLTYWVHHGTIDSQRSLFLCLLGKPQQAVDAASTARARFDRTFVGDYGRCQIRLGHALILSKEISEATHILGDAASHARLSPRLTQELHTARALLQPWNNTHAVKALDAQLEANELLSLRPT
jgi:transcriptional regulator with XRE-family HTH domain/tetratricopeptide (TPR) repeat protein